MRPLNTRGLTYPISRHIANQPPSCLLVPCCRVRNADDARDVFKMLRSQAIGASSAVLYYGALPLTKRWLTNGQELFCPACINSACMLTDTFSPAWAEWAALELAGGNQFKALSVVGKGLKEAAQPARWVLAVGRHAHAAMTHARCCSMLPLAASTCWLSPCCPALRSPAACWSRCRRTCRLASLCTGRPGPARAPATRRGTLVSAVWGPPSSRQECWMSGAAAPRPHW